MSKSQKRLPLKGRTILVTQASHQADHFISLLKQKGASVLHCPTIDIVSYEPSHTKDTLRKIKRYDWIVFMSQNAVFYFFEAMKKYHVSCSLLKGVRIASIGKTTRECLKNYKIRVHLTPSLYQSEGLLKAFKGKIEERKFLIVSALNGRSFLTQELKKHGGKVDQLPLYKTMLPLNHSRKLLQYICEERIDAVTFTSPSTVENFITMVNPHRERSMQRQLEGLTIAVLGDVTAQAVESFNLRVRVQPSEFTIPSFVNTLCREL